MNGFQHLQNSEHLIMYQFDHSVVNDKVMYSDLFSYLMSNVLLYNFISCIFIQISI
jgi:hypothetical protein